MDAVGEHALAIARSLRRLGFKASLYAQNATEGVKDLRLFWSDKRRSDIVILIYSIFDDNLPDIASHQGPKICYYHGVTPAALLAKYEPRTAELCARSRRQLRLIRKFDLLVCNSKFTATDFRGKMPNGRVVIIPPLSQERLKQFRKRRPKKHSNKKPQILFVGRIAPHKNVEEIIAIAKKLKDRDFDAHWDLIGVAGNAEYNKTLQTLVSDFGLEQRVRFLGALSNRKLTAKFKKADVFLTASRHEGFCVPVLEAFAFNLPVVARSGTAAQEFADGAALFYKSPNQGATHLVRVLSDKQLSSRLQRMGGRRLADISKQIDDRVWLGIVRQAVRRASLRARMKRKLA